MVLLADPRDAFVPVDTSRRLARALPDASLQLVPGAGHHLPRHAPDAVADAIAAFLAAVEDPPAQDEAHSLTFGDGSRHGKLVRADRGAADRPQAN